MKKKFYLLLTLLLLFSAGVKAQTSEPTVTPLNFGYRPINAWMEPVKLTIGSTGTPLHITAMDLDNSYFTTNVEAPFDTPKTIDVTTGEAEAGEVTANLSFMYNEASKSLKTFEITATAYDPANGDVWEKATVINDPTEYTDTPDFEGIYHNYNLPGEGENGKDAVYKMTLANDIMLSVGVSKVGHVDQTADNAKMALYTEDFNGEGGPMADNNYTYTPSNRGDRALTTILYEGFEGGSLPSGWLKGGSWAIKTSQGGINACAGSYSAFQGGNSIYQYESMTSAAIDLTQATSATLTFKSINKGGWIGYNYVYVYVREVQTTQTPSGETPILNYAAFLNENSWTTHTCDLSAYLGKTVYVQFASMDLGATFGVDEFKVEGEVGPAEPVYDIENMYVPAGTYYLATAATEAFQVNMIAEAAPAPVQAEITYPTDEMTGVESPLTAMWNLGDYTTEMQVKFGTSYPPETVIDWTTDLTESLEIEELTPNTTYFLQVNERNANGTTEGEVIGFVSAFIKPVVEVAENQLYPGDAAELSWELDRSFRGYNVYVDGEKWNTELIEDDEYDVEGLAHGIHTINVTAVYDEGESGYSNDVYVVMTGFGHVSGTVYEMDATTPVEGAAVKFIGTDMYGADQTFTFTTAANGTFAGDILEGEYASQAELDGCSIAAGSEFSINYEETIDGLVYYLREEFVAPGQVNVEITEANKANVWWDWNPAALVEDFEHDGEMPEGWNQVGSYGWVITTNSPYEGTYCLKSNNTGVNSSTAGVEITVEVPYDGKMSFYIKPSSETSWDKGYFYIDGAEKCTVTGAGSWTKKEFNVSEGTHTYKWTYTKDGSVGSNDDCIYLDYVTLYEQIQPEPPFAGGWIYYDDGTYASSVGAGGTVYWGIAFPANTAYTGCTLNKVNYYAADQGSGSITLNIYTGGESAPGTLVSTQNFSITSGAGWTEVTLNTPVTLTGTEQLWITCYNSGITYPASACAYVGEPLSCQVSTDGATWAPVTSYSLSYSWMLRGYLTAADGTSFAIGAAEAAPQNVVMPELTFNGGVGGELAVKVAETPVYTGTPEITRGENGTRSFQKYKVYRKNVLEGEQAVVTNTTDTCYLDNAWTGLADGVYMYGVSAVYDGNRNRSEETILTEGFEGGIPSTWSQEGSGMMWYQDSEFAAPQGAYAARVDCNWSGASSRYLITPALNFGGATEGTLTFKAHQHMQSWGSLQYGPDPIYVYYRTSSIGSWNRIATITTSNPTYGSYDFHEIELPTTALTSTTQIAFQSGYADGYGSFIDDIVITKYKGIVPPTPPTGEGESEITWSDPVDHNMIAAVDFTAVTNNGQSVAGTVVTFTNTVEEGYVYEATLDETGFVAFPEFRKGYYELAVELDGYVASCAGDVEIFDDEMTFNCELTESIIPANNLYVSQTGWVMWNNTERAAQYSIVKLNGVVAGQPTTNYFQLDETSLVDGQEYTVEVASMYASGMSEWRTATFTYRPSDPYYKTGVKNFAAETENADVTLSFELPGGGGVGDEFSFDFEDGFQGWTNIDADGDGNIWLQASGLMTGVYGHNNSADFMVSQSYINYVGALNPDNYLVSPQQYHVGGSSVFSMWACGQDANYAAEHFGVAISTSGNTSASDFTTIAEWTIAGKGNGKAMRNGKDQSTWVEYTADLSDYAGEDVWIAVRHFNCTDQFYLDADDFSMYNADKKGNREMWDLVTSFSVSSAGQQGICTDGEYLYTSCWAGNPGWDFGKYELDGTFIEGFSISGASGVRDLTWDGEYFYGSSGSSQIYILDLANKTKVGSINCSGATCRHCTWDPVRDAFWVGNWSDLFLYDRNGTKLLTGPTPSSAYGSGYFEDENGEEHLYLFCQPSSDAKVYDYNITTGTLGSSPVLDFSQTPGFSAGISGGSYVGTYGDKICWFGNAQQDPNLVGIYELGEAESPLAGGYLGAYIFRDGELITPEPLTRSPYVDENVAEGEHVYTARLVYGNAEYGTADSTWYAMSIPSEVTVEVEVECIPVEELEATAVYNEDGTYGVQLEWICTGAEVQGYKVYRNDSYIGMTTNMEYYDERTNNPGDYTYGVVAVYAYCEAEMVEAEVNVDAIGENSVIGGMYPNPTTGVLNIDATAMQQITVVNALGQVVYNSEVSGDNTTIDMSAFGAGVYMVTVRTENGTSVQRVTVMK